MYEEFNLQLLTTLSLFAILRTTNQKPYTMKNLVISYIGYYVTSFLFLFVLCELVVPTLCLGEMMPSLHERIKTMAIGSIILAFLIYFVYGGFYHKDA